MWIVSHIFDCRLWRNLTLWCFWISEMYCRIGSLSLQACWKSVILMSRISAMSCGIILSQSNPPWKFYWRNADVWCRLISCLTAGFVLLGWHPYDVPRSGEPKYLGEIGIPEDYINKMTWTVLLKFRSQLFFFGSTSINWSSLNLFHQPFPPTFPTWLPFQELNGTSREALELKKIHRIT